MGCGLVTACCFIHHLGYHFLLLSEDSTPWSSSRRGSCLPSASNRGRPWSFTSRRECMMFYYLLPALYPTFTSLLATSGGSGLFSGGCSASSSASCSSSSGPPPLPPSGIPWPFWRVFRRSPRRPLVVSCFVCLFLYPFLCLPAHVLCFPVCLEGNRGIVGLRTPRLLP